MANKFQIKNIDRCRLYNMQPIYGDLETATESKYLRYELIDKLSEEQKEARGISKNGLDQYEVTPEKANEKTDMTLSDESLAVFKSFINKTSAKKQVYYEDSELFNQILAAEPTNL